MAVAGAVVSAPARAAAMPVDPRLGEAEQAALIASADLVLATGSDLAIQQTGNRNAGLQDLTPIDSAGEAAARAAQPTSRRPSESTSPAPSVSSTSPSRTLARR